MLVRPADAVGIEKCAIMMDAELSGLALQSSLVVPEQQSLPSYCKIRGKIAHRIGFEARFPIKTWNSRLFMAGCGGFCGSYQPDKETYSNSINPALRRGYATLITDGGHEGENYDTSWAMDDDEALEIFAHKMLPMGVAALEELSRVFYGSEVQKRIFSGCSNGGRLGLIAAQRYPDLFDGILVGGPILDMAGNAGHHGAWLIQQNRDDKGDRVITRQAVEILEQEVIKQCDVLDGQLDGVISDPRVCKPDLSILSCTRKIDGHCLKEKEIATIYALYQGVHDSNGTRLFFGILPGGEHNWPLWITGNDEMPGWGHMAGDGYLKLAAHKLQRPQLAALSYNFSSDAETLNTSYLPELLDATNPDLSAFEKSGGKMIVWHGWADSLIMPERSVRYYESVVRKSGSFKKTQNFMRLFMVPGHGHCWALPGKGPDQFDPLLALDNWLEKGKAPDQLIAYEKNDQGGIVRSRPICAYPKAARLIKKDQPDSSASYLCQADSNDELSLQ